MSHVAAVKPYVFFLVSKISKLFIPSVSLVTPQILKQIYTFNSFVNESAFVMLTA